MVTTGDTTLDAAALERWLDARDAPGSGAPRANITLANW